MQHILAPAGYGATHQTFRRGGAHILSWCNLIMPTYGTPPRRGRLPKMAVPRKIKTS